MSPVTPVLRFHLMSGGRRESPRIVRFPPIAETIFLQHLFCGSSSRMGPQPSRHLFSTDRPKAHRAIPRGTVNLVNFPSLEILRPRALGRPLRARHREHCEHSCAMSCKGHEVEGRTRRTAGAVRERPPRSAPLARASAPARPLRAQLWQLPQPDASRTHARAARVGL